MSLLEQLVQKCAEADLELIFTKVGIKAENIHADNHQHLKEVTLAQWLLESARATSHLAVNANNFAGLKWREPEMNGFATAINIKVPSEPETVNFCKFESLDNFIKGYWRFLTRPHYKGVEEHTNTPQIFIEFLKNKGYAGDPHYVSKVMRLLPEAQQLLATTRGATITLVPAQLQVTRVPKEVEAGQNFRIAGVASPQDKGKVLAIKIDNQFPADGVPIGEDGKWLFDFVFHEAGDRTMQISTGSQTVEINIKAVTAGNVQDTEEISKPLGSIVINLTKSVGLGVVNNNPGEVKAVKQRLRDLGYTWVGNLDSVTIDTGTVKAIKLFQSIINGRSTIQADGRIDVNEFTHRWLQAANAPRWIAMPPSDPVIGFVNFEREQTHDNHDFGTHWLADTILAIAKDYQSSHRDSHAHAAPFVINDVSVPHGGDTPDHAGHETGLMCDVLLPKQGGSFGGINWFDANFDRSATRALLKSIHKQKLVRAVFFNDTILRGEKLCTFDHGHDNHIHFEINPPVRI
ncbi:MAG TPA: muramidase (flagellum-specific) [Cyanobacteria bacterium UBA8803]|nr:muramidase (flagellum-specific) [Cyanobacteria bacterium UBA9273]HBL60015.1 muramidase (flagellum-specific) [Cyanobacteria bacterium UBA8803]